MVAKRQCHSTTKEFVSVLLPSPQDPLPYPSPEDGRGGGQTMANELFPATHAGQDGSPFHPSSPDAKALVSGRHFIKDCLKNIQKMAVPDK